MTSLRHHGGDKWSIRAYVGTNPLTGQPRRRSISFRANGKRAAEKKARELGQRLDAERAAMTADDYVDAWSIDGEVVVTRIRGGRRSELHLTNDQASQLAERLASIAAAASRSRVLWL